MPLSSLAWLRPGLFWSPRLAFLRAPFTGECWRCKKALDHTSIVTVDLDQAYEACACCLVLPAWLRMVSRYEAVCGVSAIDVRKGKSDFTAVPSGPKGKGWFRLSMAVITRAITAYTSASLVIVCGLVFSLKGLPIGGVMSTVSLAVVLCDAEIACQAES